MYPINPEHRALVDLLVEQHQAQIRADVRKAREAGVPQASPVAALAIIVLAVVIMSVTSVVA